MTDGPDEVPVVDGSIYGGAAFAVGYLTTLVLVVFVEGDRLLGDTIDGAGWLYYNAQFVSVEERGFASVDAGVGDGGEISGVNYLTGSGLEAVASEGTNGAITQLPAVLYHAIPVVAFVAFGLLLARKLGVETVSTGAKVGASLALGGVLAALGGTYLFEVGNAIGPNRFEAVALAGIVYPVVCGAVGGVLGAVLCKYEIRGFSSR